MKAGVAVVEWHLPDNIDDEMFATAIGHIIKDLIKELPVAPHGVVVATEGLAEEIIHYANILNDARGT